MYKYWFSQERFSWCVFFVTDSTEAEFVCTEEGEKAAEEKAKKLNIGSGT